MTLKTFDLLAFWPKTYYTTVELREQHEIAFSINNIAFRVNSCPTYFRV